MRTPPNGASWWARGKTGPGVRRASSITRQEGSACIRVVLVPLDGSDLAAQVLPYAEMVAKSTGATVLLLRVVNPYPGELVREGMSVYRETDDQAGPLPSARRLGRHPCKDQQRRAGVPRPDGRDHQVRRRDRRDGGEGRRPGGLHPGGGGQGRRHAHRDDHAWAHGRRQVAAGQRHGQDGAERQASDAHHSSPGGRRTPGQPGGADGGRLRAVRAGAAARGGDGERAGGGG